MAKRKLTPSEISILRQLIFVEPFSHLVVETGYSNGVIRDDLITLINQGYIEVYSEDQSRSISPFYDSDNIQKFSFKATNSGLKNIQQYAI